MVHSPRGLRYSNGLADVAGAFSGTGISERFVAPCGQMWALSSALQTLWLIWCPAFVLTLADTLLYRKRHLSEVRDDAFAQFWDWINRKSNLSMDPIVWMIPRRVESRKIGVEALGVLSKLMYRHVLQQPSRFAGTSRCLKTFATSQPIFSGLASLFQCCQNLCTIMY